MKKYKLIVSDLDDTLLTSEGKVPTGLRESIARYVGTGGKFCIATGRMTVGTKFVCEELDLKGEIITYQGAVVSRIEDGEVLFTQCIAWKEAAEIARYLEKRGVYFQTYEGDNFLVKKGTEYSALYGKISNAEYRETGINLSEYIERGELDPPKLLIIEEPAKVGGLMAELREKFGKKFRINTSKPFIIEIIPPEISKAVAVDSLAKKYGIEREEVICVGDSENDVPMLEYAGLGVAVMNASDEVKKCAEVVAPSCDNGGLKWVVDNYGFLE